MLNRTFVIIVSLVLSACSPVEENPSYDVTTGESVMSNSGHEAYIIETNNDGNYQTQVLIKYSNGQCGTGAVNAADKDLSLDIKWKNDSTLIITKPANIELNLNASGSELKCDKQTVFVVIDNA
jgi:hypothetical protein